MKSIAITGTIGSGKSTCVKILESLGYVVFNCDAKVKSYLDSQGVLYNEVIDFFGTSILQDDKKLDKKLIAKIIFNDAEIKKRYEQLIYKQLKQDLLAAMSCSKDVFFAEVPLLFETDFKDLFDDSWLVVASEENIVKRLKQSRFLSEEEIFERINSQMLVEEKMLLSTKIIYNDGDVEDLKLQVCDLLEKEGILNGTKS